MNKKVTALLVALVLMLCMLTGCGGDSANYPALEAADYSGLQMATFGNSTITASYPSDTWLYGGEVNGLPSIYLIETADTNEAININMQANGVYPRAISDEVLTEICNNFTVSGMTIDTAEIRTLNGEPISYIEATTQFTDEMLDSFIEQGIYTDDLIEAVGGRDFLLSRPPVHTISITAKVDGWLCIYSGTYMHEADKELVLDVMTMVIQTSQISK